MKLQPKTSQIEKEIIANLPPLRIPRLRHHRVTDWDPYFENAEGQGINGSQNVALHLGATALLDCRVAMLSGKKVMWLRRNADWASLLTLGNTTHISDPRCVSEAKKVGVVRKSCSAKERKIEVTKYYKILNISVRPIAKDIEED
ncbi:hypothetical protein WN51_10317 [Melipona quadrifasciata]|uniref:Ig-like domain-containing protein n=1 Tax=Melipona quadrifasciata TaxID=166423 RepID=A0A0M9A4S7_9HYME|nr:hypothetical protein WN51_10317 [Melipona quadrifasciata]